MALCGVLGVVGSACTYQTIDLSPTLPPNAQSSVLLAADGTTLTVLHGIEDRVEVPLEAVPDHFVDAIVSIEDRRFFQHGGVDLRAIIRATLRNVDDGTISEGGSTITQQYVKNVMMLTDRTLDRKIYEASLAFQVERAYSKDEILEFYLNTVYFGAGAYGVQAASQTYFGKDVDELLPAESALLAGLIKAPASYDPYRYPDAAMGRRRLVLDAMVSNGRLDTTAAELIAGTPIHLSAPDADRSYPAAYFVEEVKQFIFDNDAFGATRQERVNLLFSGGLTIETTLDPQLQREAERAIDRVLIDPEGDPDVAVVTIDPANGHVLALVGGRDFFGEDPQAKFNLATQGRRPAASAFKPLVLAAALEEGTSLDAMYTAPSHLDVPITGSTWAVENYAGTDGGRVDLIDATVHSYNTVYAQLIMNVGPSDAMATARALGVQSPLLAVPSAVLGANDVTPLDMTTAYATLASGGIRHTPTFVTRVTAADGRILYEHRAAGTRAVSEATADAVTGVLQQVVQRGTAIHARIGRPVAGKTGTGQNWADAWFVGYTPSLVTGVWVGFAEAHIPMEPPRTRIRVTGGTWPVDIWQLYMTAALAEAPIEDFRVPPPTSPDRATHPPIGQKVVDTVGLPEQLASELLTRAGFVVEIDAVPSDQYPAGYVIGTLPAADTLAEGGSAVVVLTASGEDVGRVPLVLGRTAASARRALEHAGYSVEVVTEPDTDVEPNAAGLVWKASQPRDRAIEPGHSVTIWVNPDQ